MTDHLEPEPDTVCAECAPDGEEVRGETTHCYCGIRVWH